MQSLPHGKMSVAETKPGFMRKERHNPKGGTMRRRGDIARDLYHKFIKPLNIRNSEHYRKPTQKIRFLPYNNRIVVFC